MKVTRRRVVFICWTIVFLMPPVAVCAPSTGVAADDVAGAGCSCEISDSAGLRAPCCRLIARPTTEEVKEDKSCRKVNCEKVPVPAITLPWEQGGSPLTLFNCLKHFAGGHASHPECAECVACCETCGMQEGRCACGPKRCGTVRVVSVLDKEKYDVTKCESKWEVQCVAPCCSCGGNQCCDP